MTSFLEDWMTVFVVATLGMVSPGPNFAITIKNSLLHSRLAGMWTAVGVAVGNLVHVVFSLLGIDYNRGVPPVGGTLVLRRHLPFSPLGSP